MSFRELGRCLPLYKSHDVDDCLYHPAYIRSFGGVNLEDISSRRFEIEE